MLTIMLYLDKFDVYEGIEMTILKFLGKRIQFIREKRNITQEELADRSGINSKYISAIERGQKNATIKTLEKIAIGLEIECYELMLFSEEIDSEQSVKMGITALLKESDLKSLRLCLQFLRMANELK